MKRVPVFATLIVAAAVAAMVALGIWQLQRAEEKEKYISVLEHNSALSAIDYPTRDAFDETQLFRESHLECLGVENWRTQAGKSATGKTGYKYIAECKVADSEKTALVNVGVVYGSPDKSPEWSGGPVRGVIFLEPDPRSLLEKMFSPSKKPGAMLVSSQKIGALELPQPPSLDNIPNNHMAYAWQWFFFAFIAALIYVLALVKRSKESSE